MSGIVSDVPSCNEGTTNPDPKAPPWEPWAKWVDMQQFGSLMAAGKGAQTAPQKLPQQGSNQSQRKINQNANNNVQKSQRQNSNQNNAARNNQNEARQGND